MTARDTSLEALNSIDLQAQENELLSLIRYHFQLGRFTRKELAARTGWTINRVTGRVFSLIEKGALTEYPQTRNGGHLLSIAQPSERAAGSAARPHRDGGHTVRSPSTISEDPAAEFITSRGKRCMVVAEGQGVMHKHGGTVGFIVVREVK
jgi:hypothetical protein